MIRGARGYMSYSAMGLIWPCIALTASVLIFNYVCDGLRDVFDPQTRPGETPPDPLPAVAPPPFRQGALLQVDDLHTHIRTERGLVRAVDGVSFILDPGETLAIVGESGSGKTMAGLSVMGLAPEPYGRIVSGHVRYADRNGEIVDLTSTSAADLERIRGSEIAMIFQEPMTALNPVYRIGDQIAETLQRHRKLDRAEAWREAVEMLQKVGVPEPALRVRAFPHELSGGLRQRAMIAMALVLRPRLIIADEPTTALDVTIQAQILELLRRLLAESDPKPALAFITHDLGVVAEIADRIVVFYAGRAVEEGLVRDVFDSPRHPYTRGLLDSVPSSSSSGSLRAIEGTVPRPYDRITGCAFAARCPLVRERCRTEEPPMIDSGAGRRSRCHYWQEVE